MHCRCLDLGKFGTEHLDAQAGTDAGGEHIGARLDGRPLVQSYSATEQLVCAGERYDLLLTIPSSGQITATVDYNDIRRAALLGSVASTITVV
jgi:hypothetical protein